MSDNHAFSMVDQLQKMARQPERRVRKLPKKCCHRAPPLPRRQIFPFLELPAEIRNMIYEYTLVERRIQRLRSFVTPALSRVCRQLRLETLPVFFHLNTFVAEVKSTFIGYGSDPYQGLKPEYVELCSTKYRDTGIVSIAADISPLIWETYAGGALFQNIGFCLQHPTKRSGGVPKYEHAVLSFRHNEPAGPSVHVQKNNYQRDHIQLSRVLEQGKHSLTELLASTGKHGLSFEEVQAVALAFRADDVCHRRERSSAAAKHTRTTRTSKSSNGPRIARVLKPTKAARTTKGANTPRLQEFKHRPGASARPPRLLQPFAALQLTASGPPPPDPPAAQTVKKGRTLPWQQNSGWRTTSAQPVKAPVEKTVHRPHQSVRQRTHVIRPTNVAPRPSTPCVARGSNSTLSIQPVLTDEFDIGDEDSYFVDLPAVPSVVKKEATTVPHGNEQKARNSSTTLLRHSGERRGSIRPVSLGNDGEADEFDLLDAEDYFSFAISGLRSS